DRGPHRRPERRRACGDHHPEGAPGVLGRRRARAVPGERGPVHQRDRRVHRRPGRRGGAGRHVGRRPDGGGAQRGRPMSGHPAGPARGLRRVAVLSLHTSPLNQPGTGDAGGMNVYVLETARELARRGVEVEIFTRATRSDLPSVQEAARWVRVRNVVAGPFEGLDKRDLPTQPCAFTAGVLRAEAQHAPGYYDLIHSHYWLSGQVGWLARERWSVPLVHTAHTL